VSDHNSERKKEGFGIETSRLAANYFVGNPGLRLIPHLLWTRLDCGIGYPQLTRVLSISGEDRGRRTRAYNPSYQQRRVYFCHTSRTGTISALPSIAR